MRTPLPALATPLYDYPLQSNGLDGFSDEAATLSIFVCKKKKKELCNSKKNEKYKHRKYTENRTAYKKEAKPRNCVMPF